MSSATAADFGPARASSAKHISKKEVLDDRFWGYFISRWTWHFKQNASRKIKQNNPMVCHPANSWCCFGVKHVCAWRRKGLEKAVLFFSLSKVDTPMAEGFRTRWSLSSFPEKGREGEGGELVHLTGCQGEQTYSESREKHALIQWWKTTEGLGNLEEKQPVRSTLSSWDYGEFLSYYWLLSPKYICCFLQLRLPMKCIYRLNDSYNYRLKRTLHIHEYHTICHSCRPPVSNACD